MSAFFPIDPAASGSRKALLVYNARLVDRDVDSPGALLARDGKIERVFIASGNSASGESAEASELAALRADPAVESVDALGRVVMPAFVDLHAHFRDPGQTQKEDVGTASRAACAGGYGTVVLMANTNPVISTQGAALEVVSRVRAEGLIDAFQAVSLTRDFDGADVSALGSLDPALVPVASEDGREVASAAVMLRAMESCAHSGVIVSCHCEDPDLAREAKPHRVAALEAARSSGLPSGRLASPGKAPSDEITRELLAAGRLLALAEDTMTERNLRIARAAGCRVHVAHVSTRASLDAVRRAKADSLSSGGFSVTCEATPHHLSLTDSVAEIVNPPLRGDADREALIAGLLDGTVDAIATDHAPHAAGDKASGAPGFSGIEIAAATAHTALVATGMIGLGKLSALMAANPAAILGLPRGLLRSGFDADFIIFDPSARFTVDPASGEWHSRGKNTPLAGATLSGVVLATYKRGVKVYGRE